MLIALELEVTDEVLFTGIEGGGGRDVEKSPKSIKSELPPLLIVEGPGPDAKKSICSAGQESKDPKSAGHESPCAGESNARRSNSAEIFGAAGVWMAFW